MARVSGSGLLRAAANVLRGGVLLGVLLTLVLARVGVPALLLVVAVAISLGALYAVDRGSGGFGWFAAYLVGFVVFALLRTMADETGIAVKADYVVDAERRLFGGALPTAWLQDRLYEPNSVGVLAVLCIVVYASYYVVPHVAALVLGGGPRLRSRRMPLPCSSRCTSGLLSRSSYRPHRRGSRPTMATARRWRA